MDVDDAGSRSVFAVVYYFNMDPPCYGLLQLDHKKVVEKARFRQPKELSLVNWYFSPPTSSTEDLYMLPSWDFVPSGCFSKPAILKQFPGYKFNFSTGDFLPISPALPGKDVDLRCVVNRRGHIYYISYSRFTRDSLFQCYDPVKKSWNPVNSVTPIFQGFRIVATAVWDDTILFNIDFCHIWAYYVSGNKWYPVKVLNRRCYDIIGEAVCLEDTIYALAHRPFYSVLALSIVKVEGIHGDLVFQCDLVSENLVDVDEPILFQNDAWMRTRDLVHLGKDDFCLVQTCGLGAFDGVLPMQLTYIKLKRGNPVIVVSDCAYDLNIQPNEPFHVLLCVSLPVCNTTGLKEGKRLVFDINPYSEEDYASNPVQEEEIVIPVQEEERPPNATVSDSSQTNIIEGHPIHVRNLPPNASVSQLEKALKKFGTIKRDRIQVRKNRKGKCLAYVEFERATSKQRAIEASTIGIGGCTAEILDTRSTGLTLADCNSTQAVGSSSFGNNKSKNHGEVSRSKMTCCGHNGGRGVYQPCRPKRRSYF